MSVATSTVIGMHVESWQYPDWLGRHRQWLARDPEAAVLPFVRALNTVALEAIPTTGPNIAYDEAQAVLTQVIAQYGATPARVRHLVMILINDAQANAFSGGPNWPDLGRALDAAESAVRWQEELLDHVSQRAEALLLGIRQQVTSDSINVHLVLARIQAACALEHDARESLDQALGHYASGDFAEEWGGLVRSVREQVEPGTISDHKSRTESQRPELWYWYGPTGTAT